MSSKADFQHKSNEMGYKLGPFTSKDTLSNIIRLHSSVLRDQNINVAELNDLELRKNLTQHGLLVGPITNHTRSIYQRKLLEVLTNETTEGDEYEIYESTPDINDENSLYTNLSDKNSFSYHSNNTYDEPLIIRNDYKATTSSRDTLTRNTYRDDDSNGIRPRFATKANDQKSTKIKKDSTSTKIDNKDKQQVAKKSGGTFLYAGITMIVALIVFVLYFWFEK